MFYCGLLFFIFEVSTLCSIGQFQIVRKAWEVRDGAVARKNKVEVQLAKTRIDVLQANSQLMEAIQQKVELSQQLEQWQVCIFLKKVFILS